MILSGNLPARPKMDRSASELLPSLSDLGILDTTPALGWSQLKTSPRGSLSLRESDSDCLTLLTTNPASSPGSQTLSSPKDHALQLSTSHNAPVRLPSFSELDAKIAFAEPEWGWDPRSMQRRSSCESSCSVPSLTDTLSNASSPVSSPRTPSDRRFSFHMPQLLPLPLPPYSAKFQLNSAPEHLLAQAKGFDSRNWRHPSSSCAGKAPWQSQTHFRHPRYSPRPGHAAAPQQALRAAHRSPCDDAAPRRNSGAVCKRSPKTPHINKEYTLEQNLWIIYNHVDLKKAWKEVEEDFGRQFGKQVQRTDGGLQSTYYRWNEECPVIDAEGLLEYGEGDGFNKWDVRVHQAKIRGHGKIPVIDRYASEIVEAGYPWVQEQDMAKARQLAERRRPYREAYESRKRARLSRLMNCS